MHDHGHNDDYERDAIASRRRLEHGAVDANIAGGAFALGLGTVSALLSGNHLRKVKKREINRLNKAKFPSKKLWANVDGKMEYTGPSKVPHVLGGVAVSAGGGYLLARHLKKKQQEEENEKMRRKHASYDQDLLEEDMERRARGRKPPAGEMAARLADKGAPIAPDLALRLGVPTAISFLAPPPIDVIGGATATFLGNAVASKRNNARMRRRLGQIEEISNMSDKELRDAHKRLIRRR